jgi:3-dehydroquinate synthetase
MEDGDLVLLPWLEREADALIQTEPEAIAAVVRHCVDLKARVVRADPFEHGLRAILNYGHTAGHALEAAAGYGSLLHGEAVAIGMRVASSIAVELGRCTPALLDRQQALVRRFGLPEAAPDLDAAALWPFIRRDKKASTGALRWVLPGEPGVVDLVRGVDEAVVDRALDVVTGGATVRRT